MPTPAHNPPTDLSSRGYRVERLEPRACLIGLQLEAGLWLPSSVVSNRRMSSSITPDGVSEAAGRAGSGFDETG